MIQRSGSADQIKKMQFWEEVWERCRKKSHLKKTQHLNPEKWREFYDRVSSLWDEITGYSGSIDNAIAGFIFDNRLAFLGSSALDIGCGPGALSFALAGSGIAVTALDNSPGMINTLKETIRQEKLLGIKTLLMDWRQLPTEPKYDLAVAGFFPDAFSPEGLCRMESFTAGTCLLVSGENETLATASTLSEEQNMPPRPPIEWTPELHSKFDKVLLLIGTAGQRFDSAAVRIGSANRARSEVFQRYPNGFQKLIFLDAASSPACVCGYQMSSPIVNS